MLLKNIILTSVVIAAAALQVAAKQAYQPKSAVEKEVPSLLAIHEGNFNCFKNLECLVRENPFNGKNLEKFTTQRRGYEHIVVEGQSKNEDLHAVYSNKGKLIKATVVQRNIVLPHPILKTLVNDDLKDWIMIGNELTIHDFNKKTMQYKVVLMRNNEVRIEYFNSNGESVSQIS